MAGSEERHAQTAVGRCLEPGESVAFGGFRSARPRSWAHTAAATRTPSPAAGRSAAGRTVPRWRTSSPARGRSRRRSCRPGEGRPGELVHVRLGIAGEHVRGAFGRDPDDAVLATAVLREPDVPPGRHDDVVGRVELVPAGRLEEELERVAPTAPSGPGIRRYTWPRRASPPAVSSNQKVPPATWQPSSRVKRTAFRERVVVGAPPGRR
jgi:hypothetical protein